MDPTIDEITQTEQVRSGQRMAIVAILLNLISVPLLAVPEGVFIRALLVIVAIVLAVLGIVRMSRGLGINLIVIVLMALGMVVPLANLVILLIINARATRFLRDRGFVVGLFGAKSRS